METSVLVHVRIQEMLQQFLPQCQWGQAVTHRGFGFFPVCLVFSIEAVYSSVSASCVKETAVLEGQ